MESWMLVIAGGATLSLAAAVGIGWSFRKLSGGARVGAVVGFVALGAVGGFLSLNATALVTTAEEAEIQRQVEASDLDAPLDDDF